MAEQIVVEQVTNRKGVGYAKVQVVGDVKPGALVGAVDAALAAIKESGTSPGAKAGYEFVVSAVNAALSRLTAPKVEHEGVDARVKVLNRAIRVINSAGTKEAKVAKLTELCEGTDWTVQGLVQAAREEVAKRTAVEV